MDNVHLRATTHAAVLGSDVLAGISLNNSPGVQDPWNTLPAWSFPYTDLDLVPHPAAATVLSGALAQSTLGATAYAWWDFDIYTEAGTYWMPGRGLLKAVGVDPDEGAGLLERAAPYVRIAYTWDFGTSNIEGGAFGFLPSLRPPGIAPGADDYTDLGVDASWLGSGTGQSTFAINSRYIHESAQSQYLFRPACRPTATSFSMICGSMRLTTGITR